MLLVITLMAGCGTTQHSGKEQKNLDATFAERNRLSIENQREFDKAYLEAINQKLKGNTDAAHELLEYALTLHPNASEALYELALLNISLSPKTDSALVAQGEIMLEKAVALEPSNKYFRSALAERCISTGRFDKAVELYEQTMSEKPDSRNCSLLMRLYMVTRQMEKALEMLEHMEQFEGYTEEVAVEKYRILMELGKKSEAFECIDRLSRENPDETRYKAMLGDVFMQQGETEEALKVYSQILAEDAGNQYVCISMLQYYASEGDSLKFDETMCSLMADAKVENGQKLSILQNYAAEQLRGSRLVSKERLSDYFRMAMALPQEDTMLPELYQAYIAAAELPKDNLIFAYETALRIDPSHMQSRLMLLQHYVEQQDTGGILDVSTEGLEQHPDELIFYYYKMVALFRLDKADEAAAVGEAGTRIFSEDADPEMVSEIYAMLGEIYHSAHHNAKAFEAYDGALKYKSDNIGVLNNYAYFLALEGGDLDKALDMSKRAVDAMPDDPTLLDTYAWVLFCKKQYTQARIYIEQMLKNLPEEEQESASSSNLYDHAGDIYFRCGDKAKALEYWNKALRLSDDEELTRQLNKKIKNRRL